MIYVDEAVQYEGKRYKMCHMLSDDSLEELHAMADKIGLKRSWFQRHSSPHYDLTESKRALAISMGAVVTDSAGIVRIIRMWREKVIAP